MQKDINKITIGTIVALVTFSGWVGYQNTTMSSFDYDYISPDEVFAYTAQEYDLLDFRSPAEQAQGTITPSTYLVNRTASNVRDEINTLNPDRGYIIYDRTGEHIDELTKILRDLEFSDIKIIDGGWQAWVQYSGR
jgi:rhodanese-related sulfurtransferase